MAIPESLLVARPGRSAGRHAIRTHALICELRKRLARMLWNERQRSRQASAITTASRRRNRRVDASGCVRLTTASKGHTAPAATAR
jgi:ABC-type transporter Mla MlaB component